MYLILPALIPLIAAGISGVSSIIGNAVQRGQSKRDIADQNAYNSPLQQVQRVREAGLPMAFLEHGQAGQQSALPTTNDAGIKDIGGSVTNYITTATQIQGLKLMKAQTDKAVAEAAEAGGRAEWLAKKTESPNGYIVSNQGRMLEAQRTMNEVDAMYKTNQANMSSIDYELKNIMYMSGKSLEGAISDVTNKMLQSRELRARIDNLAKAGELIDLNGRQIKNILEFKEAAARDIKNGRIPDFGTLIYLYMQGGMNTPSLGDIGNFMK